MSKSTLPDWVLSVQPSNPNTPSWAPPPANDGVGDHKLAEKIRFIADMLADEDAADALHAIADEVEVDVPAKGKLQLIESAPYYPPMKIQNEMEKCLEDLICELGWLIDEEELPGNDYNAPRKKTKASRRLREILLRSVPLDRIPGCTPWLQDEQGDTLE